MTLIKVLKEINKTITKSKILIRFFLYLNLSNCTNLSYYIKIYKKTLSSLTLWPLSSNLKLKKL